VTITAITEKGEEAIRSSLELDKKSSITHRLMFKAYKFHKDIISENPLIVQFTVGDGRIQQLLDADTFEQMIRSRLDCDNKDINVEVI
jgi:hypothetical protein